MSATATLERPANVQPTPAPNAPRSTSRRRTPASKANAEQQGKPDAALTLQAKQCAIRFLERRGYDILERDWSCHAGYVDAICRDPESNAVVFVEVKTRRKGFPPDATTPEKRERLEGTALAYLTECDCCDVPVRFDTVSIVPVATDKALIRHHINAFGGD